MTKIDTKQYPKDLDWDSKVFSMPNIPHGEIGLIAVLKEILVQVANNTTPSKVIKFDGSESRLTLNELCVRLRPMKLMLKTVHGWTLSQESEIFLESDDTLYLAAVLCANIKFLGEILFYLDSAKKATELQQIAVNEYGLMWKSGSDINSRLLWLRTLGFVEFQDFSLLYSITELGQDFLKTIHITERVAVDYNYDDTDSETELKVAQWARELIESDKWNSNKRKSSLGYIPGNIKDFDNTIREYLEVSQNGAIYDTILNFTEKNFGVAHSSLRSFMTTLKNMGMIKRKTNVMYVQSELADLWMENHSIMDLLFILHSKFTFIFEILDYIRSEGKTYRELDAISKVTNAFEHENIDGIRKRIAILKAAKLVKNITVDKFIVTNRGSLLLKEINLKTSTLLPDETPEKLEETVETKASLSDFLTDLRLSVKDSGNYRRLEKNLATAFEYLGFAARWISGSGNTDVLIHTPSAPKYSFSVAVDVKTTLSGNVSDGNVNFDSLIEHRKKHKANYSAIVGGNFQSERLIKRAKEHNVVLIDIDSLEQLILNQMQVPLKVSAYKALFEKAGLVDITVLVEERNKVMRYGKLLHAVMDCLVEESEDPVTEGLLQGRDIYRSLRSDDRFQYTPTLEEISDMLDFMSSPLIGCVEKTKDGYYAVGSVADAAKKFDFYSKSCL